MAKERTTKRRIVSELDFPASATEEEKIKFLLEYAILAPSAFNTQPWKFKIEGARISFLGNFETGLKAADSERRQAHVSLGATVANFLVAADRFGVPAAAEFPSEGFAGAIVTLNFGALHNNEEHAKVSGGAGSAFTPEIFGAIPTRRTSRGLFRMESIPEDVISHLASAVVGGDGILLSLVTGEEPKRNIGEILKGAQTKLGESREYRQEVSRWVRSAYSKKLDGAVCGFSGPLSILNSRIAKTFHFWKREAENLGSRFSPAPLVCVLSTETDLRQAWVRTGLALQLMALTAASIGYETETSFAPADVPEFRTQLKEIVGQPGFPQAVVRIGSAERLSSPTPRKPVGEFLEK
ncbi:MAG: nitroreductase family protein [archaeon]